MNPVSKPEGNNIIATPIQPHVGLGIVMSEKNESGEVLAKVNKGRSPNSEINATIAELNGYQQSIENGRLGIIKPGKASARGVDYATYDPEEGIVYITDSKYRASGGSFPRTIPQKKVKSWTEEVQNTVQNWPDSPYKSKILETIKNGNVRPEIFKWPK
ncbi:hypothetical protein H8K55_08545 [Undibacterium sp. LX15W]|uniref:Uncharacterized protein n=1 Tax=Undibacterium flavidum TaxID=2762297 RepID=A0ABR6YAH8_9BURK|nr:hypothetical protein [Undibacterium flavidum]